MSLLQEPIEQFGKYQLLRKIGHGGMAEVFLAHDTETPVETPPIVIKRLHRELENDRDAVDLFLTEADVTLLLRHPNVIDVYDSGEVDGRYFIAMEYIDGKTLEQIVERFLQKRLMMDPNAAIHILIEMLRGLGYVHEAKTASGRPLGIVHRDVTPSNIFVSGKGEIKLGDFGVAKLIGVESWTMAGSIKGKLGYLSPEQVSNQPPDIMIDLWAAAVILFELCASERLFVGDNELNVLLRIRAAKTPNFRKVNPNIGKPLADILEKALCKKARKRFLSAKEFSRALCEYQKNYGATYTPQALVTYFSGVLA